MTTQPASLEKAQPQQSGFAATDVLINEYDGGPDTVSRAAETPEELQPHADLGLKDDEYDRIRDILGRRPTSSELAMYSIMWSEHCSYKSSKVHLRQFGQKAPQSSRMLAGIGENAGVVQISDDLAVTFKVESHNHPSFVEPYQGAATGVGGIVRDILAMGARPIAVMDPLRFGAADHPDTARVLPGVVAGIAGYGNCLGLPNIGGEVVFDPTYQGNPLVNALSIGVLPVERLQHKEAAGVGNVVVLLGARTGRDGIGGVSVLASATFDEGASARRPSVQVGDPFMEKLLIESCLELYDAGLVVGIQDLGGAGLTCALTETAAAAGTGMRVYLERVPLREPSMSPTEILASESQERMLLIVAPDKLDRVLAVAEKWGVWATAIGEVTPSEQEGLPGRLVISWNDHIVVDVPPGSLADDGPVYARPIREPADLILLQADRAETLPRPATSDELRATVLRMVASPNLCDKTWVTEQYDRYVLGNTVLAQPEDAGVLRIDERTGLGVALSVDGNGRYARLDPYEGAKLALAEAYRNVVVTGAEPAAVTDCLNFGSPEDPAVMWQFAEAVRGLADGCQQLGIPVTGGNVSFYNQTGAAAIHPTPVVGVLGIFDDVARRVPMGFAPPPTPEGDLLFLLGDTRCELSGSEWAWVEHGHLGGCPPQVDLEHEQALGRLLARSSEAGHVSAAHDLSDGGLAQVLAESCLRRNIGARVALPEDHSAFVWLFSESAGRVLVAVPRGHDKAFVALAEEHGVSCTPIGTTSPDPVLEVRDEFAIELDELREAYTATIPRLFGGPAELANRHGDPEKAAHPDSDAAPDPSAAPAESSAPAAPASSGPASSAPGESSGSAAPASPAPAGTPDFAAPASPVPAESSRSAALPPLAPAGSPGPTAFPSPPRAESSGSLTPPSPAPADSWTLSTAPARASAAPPAPVATTPSTPSTSSESTDAAPSDRSVPAAPSAPSASSASSLPSAPLMGAAPAAEPTASGTTFVAETAPQAGGTKFVSRAAHEASDDITPPPTIGDVTTAQDQAMTEAAAKSVANVRPASADAAKAAAAPQPAADLRPATANADAKRAADAKPAAADAPGPTAAAEPAAADAAGPAAAAEPAAAEPAADVRRAAVAAAPEPTAGTEPAAGAEPTAAESTAAAEPTAATEPAADAEPKPASPKTQSDPVESSPEATEPRREVTATGKASVHSEQIDKPAPGGPIPPDNFPTADLPTSGTKPPQPEH